MAGVKSANRMQQPRAGPEPQEREWNSGRRNSPGSSSASDGDVDHPRIALLTVKLVARIRQEANHRREHPRLVALAAVGGAGETRQALAAAAACAACCTPAHAFYAIRPCMRPPQQHTPVPPHAGDALQQHSPGVAQPPQRHQIPADSFGAQWSEGGRARHASAAAPLRHTQRTRHP